MVAETENIEVAVAACLPRARLPVLLIVLTPDAALAEVAATSASVRLCINTATVRKPPEAAGAAAAREVVRPRRALAATGILGVFLLLPRSATIAVKRLLSRRIKLGQLPRQDVLPVLLLSRRHARLQLLNDAADRVHDCCWCFRVYYFETYLS